MGFLKMIGLVVGARAWLLVAVPVSCSAVVVQGYL